MFGIVRRRIGFGGFHASTLERCLNRMRPALSASRWYSSSGKQMTIREALNSALDEEMSADPKVFLMGEEVGEYQGAYKISKGLLEKYGPERVLDTPITEAGFTGIGVGAAYYGLKPVIEFMTFNFSMQWKGVVFNPFDTLRHEVRVVSSSFIFLLSKFYFQASVTV
ncbi:pyruvate dehydrogenase E1 component subunit beta-1, mitochondrial-like isoform X2 [Macadamia integrifolia]|nr:pyruvate dehydrogenase E1 component subunit beta-1, mitochondrial-like isoform X2 [Macadamia integrifolia]